MEDSDGSESSSHGYRHRRAKRPRNLPESASSSSDPASSIGEQDSPPDQTSSKQQDSSDQYETSSSREQDSPEDNQGEDSNEEMPPDSPVNDGARNENEVLPPVQVQQIDNFLQQGDGGIAAQAAVHAVNLQEARNAAEIASESENESVASAAEIPNIVLESEYSSDEDSEGSDDGGDDNDKLYQGSRISVAAAMLAILSFFMRHRLTGQCLSDLLSLFALLCPPNNRCIKTLYKFKKHFSMIGQSLLVFHYFCSNCQVPLATKDDMCETCGEETKADYFLELLIISQLEAMFLREGFYDALQFRFRRRKKNEGNFEDIYDGEIYKDQMANGFLSNPNNISFMWYSDGISIFKSSNFSIWVQYLVINKLNYKSRTKRENMFLADLWFGSKKPNANLFLSPLHDHLVTLADEGHIFQRANGIPICVRARLLIGVGDLQAKALFMRQKQYNGFHGCLDCLIPGERYDIGGNASVHVYPYSPVMNLRNNADVPRFAMQATEARRRNAQADVFGVKGPTLLYYMLPNLIKCMAIDPMHGIFLGGDEATDFLVV